LAASHIEATECDFEFVEKDICTCNGQEEWLVDADIVLSSFVLVEQFRGSQKNPSPKVAAMDKFLEQIDSNLRRKKGVLLVVDGQHNVDSQLARSLDDAHTSDPSSKFWVEKKGLVDSKCLTQLQAKIDGRRSRFSRYLVITK